MHVHFPKLTFFLLSPNTIGVAALQSQREGDFILEDTDFPISIIFNYIPYFCIMLILHRISNTPMFATLVSYFQARESS